MTAEEREARKAPKQEYLDLSRTVSRMMLDKDFRALIATSEDGTHTIITRVDDDTFGEVFNNVATSHDQGGFYFPATIVLPAGPDKIRLVQVESVKTIDIDIPTERE